MGYLSRVALLVVLLCSSGCALTGAAALKRLPPTPAKEPSDVLSAVMAATISHVLGLPSKSIAALTAQPRVVVLQDSDYIAADVLPAPSPYPFVLLSPDAVTEIANWNGDFFYLRLELRALSDDKAQILFEIVRTMRHCCKTGARVSAMANLVKQPAGWNVLGIDRFVNPVYAKLR